MNKFILIAGPCAVETKEQVTHIYEEIRDTCDYFRAGAYKPRTNPENFQGLREEAIEILKGFNDKKIVSEIVSPFDVKQFEDFEMIQIGARNMQNFELLKEVGKLNKVVLLKRGLSATFDELIGAAKYLEMYGAKEVILCERGIRTFSDTSRFTLDLSMVIKVKDETNYKIIVDPSHSAGKSNYVEALSLAAVAAGADGLIVEVHNNPKQALSDSEQQLTINEYKDLLKKIELIKNCKI